MFALTSRRCPAVMSMWGLTGTVALGVRGGEVGERGIGERERRKEGRGRKEKDKGSGKE